MIKKVLKILFYTILIFFVFITTISITIYAKYKKVEGINQPAKYIEAIVQPSNGKVQLGEKVQVVYILNIPWNKEPLKLELSPGKGSQAVGTPYFTKEKLHWGYYTWKAVCCIQPFVNGEIPEGKVTIIISPDKNGDTTELKLKFPKIFSEEIPVTKNTLNIASSINENEQPITNNQKYFIVAGIILLIICALIYFLFFRRKKDKTMILTSWAEALLELNSLKDKLKEKAFNAERSISILTDIVRNYLEARFEIHAPKQTTEEFLKNMEGWKSPLNNKDRNFLRDFMTTADMIKFAKLDTSNKQVSSAIERAEELVKETIPDESNIKDKDKDQDQDKTRDN